MSSIHSWYFTERWLYSGVGTLTTIIGFIQWYSERYQPSVVKLLHKIFHITVTLMGLIIIIWSVDTQGVFGIYDYWSIPIIKDTLKLCQLLDVLYLVSNLITIIRAGHGLLPIENIEKKLVIIPMTALVVILYVSDFVGSAQNRIGPRAVGSATIAVICFVDAIISFWTCVIIYKIDSRAARVRSSEGQHVLRKLLAVGMVLVAMFAVHVGDTIDGIVRDAPGSLQKEQTPQDPSKPRVYASFGMFLLGVLACIGVGWIPMRFSSDTQAASVANKNPRNSKDRNVPTVHVSAQQISMHANEQNDAHKSEA